MTWQGWILWGLCTATALVNSTTLWGVIERQTAQAESQRNLVMLWKAGVPPNGGSLSVVSDLRAIAGMTYTNISVPDPSCQVHRVEGGEPQVVLRSLGTERILTDNSAPLIANSIVTTTLANMPTVATKGWVVTSEKDTP